MFKRILLLLALICMIVLPVFGQTGTYTTHNLFYLPKYGAYGLTEYNEYNDYMEIADLQIWANKTMGEASVDTSGTPVANDIPRFIDLNTIEGLNYAELKAALDLEIGTDLQAYDAGLLSLAGLTYASPSFIKATAEDTYVIRTIAETITDLALDSDDLSDVASIAMLDENEIITVCWYFHDVVYQEYSSDLSTYYPLWGFIRSRDGDPTYVVTTGDILGALNFSGARNEIPFNGLGAVIRAVAEGTFGTDDFPTKLEFFTTPDDSGTLALRLAIDNAGNIKMGDGVWTNYVNVSSAGVLTLEGTANIEGVDATEFGHLDGVTSDIQTQFGLRYLKTEMDSFSELQAIISDKTLVNTTDKLSAFAPTTSAELAGVISDEIGAGKARFDTSVTAKTTTATLNVNEAGTILVSATGGAYTITLPTAVNNLGLTYHFIKTDANYTLITIDGDGTETINYENSTSAPVLTYARLNTYCAEVTVVSDNSNWQVINEAMGQNPSFSVYLGTDMDNIINNTITKVCLDTEEYDIGNNFNLATWISGTATATSANHLVDTTNNQFTAAMVGYRVKNTTDTTYAYITAYNSTSDVTVNPDIFINGEGYEIKNAKYVCPVDGIYWVRVQGTHKNTVVDKKYCVGFRGNEDTVAYAELYIDAVAYVNPSVNDMKSFSKDDEITMVIWNASGVDTVDIHAGASNTYMHINLIQKN